MLYILISRKLLIKFSHDALTFKLETIGIRGKTLKWIINWLTGRKQRVIIKGNYGMG